MEEAEPPTRSAEGEDTRSPRPCLNCGRTVAGAFCPHCGQRRDLRPLSLRGLVWELLIEILDTDARVWRTLRCLVREPGQLTLDWASGRRVRHVPPFRLYLVLNVLVFLVFSFTTDTNLVMADDASPHDTGEAQLLEQLEDLENETGPGVAGRRRGLERALAAVRTAQAARAEQSAEPTDEETEAPPDFSLTTDPEFSAFLAGMGIDEARAEAAVAEIVEDPRAFGERIYESLPTVMILLLPVLALAMSVLYLFTGRPYVVHLVGLAHLHAFVFLLLLLVDGFQGFGALLGALRVPVLPEILDWATLIGFAVGFWYLTTWLRRLYGHGTAGAITMSLVLSMLHVIGAALGVALVMVITLIASVRG